MPGTVRWVASVVLLIGAAACTQDAQPPGAAGGEDLAGGSVDVPDPAVPLPDAPREGVGGRFEPSAQPAGAEPDTLRGTVEVVGSDPATFVVLMGARGPGQDDPGGGADAGGAGVVLLGHGDVLRQLVGLEVEVRGSMGSPGPTPGAPIPVRSFQVASAVVRAHAGRPAVDGLLRRDGDHWVIENMDGVQLTLPDLPAALHGMEGMRVWLSLGPDRSPGASGVIR